MSVQGGSREAWRNTEVPGVGSAYPVVTLAPSQLPNAVSKFMSYLFYLFFWRRADREKLGEKTEVPGIGPAYLAPGQLPYATPHLLLECWLATTGRGTSCPC